jgi:hypothetical protein
MDPFVVLTFVACCRFSFGLTIDPMTFELPRNVTRLIINLGSNVDPPIPRAQDEATIAFEPNVRAAARIPKHPRLFVICAAVGLAFGFHSFHIDPTRNGDSSALTRIRKGKFKSIFGDDPLWERNIVPTVPFSSVLDAIPEGVELIYLKTDLQGWDYEILSSVGPRIRAAKLVQAEVYGTNMTTTYETGFPNSARHMTKFMETNGFETKRLPPPGREGDGVWIRNQ